MLKVWKILVTTLVLAGSAAVLTACGQKGPLLLPTTPASAGRATLPQTLNPFHPHSPKPAAPAAPALTAPKTTTRP